MPNIGDSFTVVIADTHTDWGEYRNPTNRARRSAYFDS